MQVPLQITYHGIPRSEALDARIRDKAEKLEEFHPRITSCRVVVEERDRHHHQGRQFTVSIDARVPGREVFPPFERLAVGTAVQFIEDLASEGRQAKRVSAGKHAGPG